MRKENNQTKAAKLFRSEFKKHFKESGLSMYKFAQQRLGLEGNCTTLVHFYVTGKRTPGLPFAIEIANKLGIDIGKIQRKCQ